MSYARLASATPGFPWKISVMSAALRLAIHGLNSSSIPKLMPSYLSYYDLSKFYVGHYTGAQRRRARRRRRKTAVAE